MSHWRSRARNVISVTKALAKQEGIADPNAILERVNAAYPFGVREYHPYRIWLDEVKKLKIELGLLPMPGGPAVSVADFWTNPPMIKPKEEA